MIKRSLIVIAVILLGISAVVVAQEDAHKDVEELYGAGQTQETLNLALEGLKTDPDHLTLNHLAGRCLVDLKRPEEGRPYLQRVVDAPERDYRYAWSLNYLANIAWMKGDDEAATQAWTKVRDDAITRNVARNANNNLRFMALDSDFADWTRIRTENCIFAFSPQHNERDRKAFADEHEQAYVELSKVFGGQAEWPVRYIVWGSIQEAEEMCGIKSLGFARPSACLIHCRWDQTLAHELTHVVSYQALHPVERTAFVNEGLAVMYDMSGRDRLATAQRAVRKAGLERMDLTAMWQDSANIEEAVLYPVAGAWMENLRARGGEEKFFEACREQTLDKAHEIYGEELDFWLTEFEAALLTEM